MNVDAEDPKATLLEVASSISDRRAVDWERVARDAGAQLSDVLDELRVLEGLARLGEDVPAQWGDFDIVGELGRGAFGTVYTAHDPALRLNVALKVIRPASPDVPFDAERAFEEARRLAKINHPNVVRVFHAQRQGNEVGVAMELVEGHTLDELVRDRGPLAVKEAALIGIDVCRALAAVHDTDTLHGDVKAHNVMRDPGGRIVLMDFGASRHLSGTRVGAGPDFAGTPLYLAPEVFAGAERSRASDVYSVGVLLYYLVTGTYPVEGSTLTEVRRGHVAPGPRQSLAGARPDVPAAFTSVVEKATASDPAQRFRSARELELALRDAVGTAPRMRWMTAGAAVATMAVALTILGTSLRDASRASGVGVAAAVPGQYRVDAAIYREENGVDVRLAPGARVAPGDKLSLHVQASVPAHVYVVNEDEKGESWLLYPLPGQDGATPLAADVTHRLPGMHDDQPMSWEITSSGQREHFLIFVRPDRSEAFERLFASLPAPSAVRRAAAPLDANGVGLLRGVGGLSATTLKADRGLRHTPEFSTPLSTQPETTAGVWVRQVAFDNP